MSLIADLLSKVKPSGHKGEVPPILKRVVSEHIESNAAKKKIILLSGLILLSIAAGFGTIYFMETYFMQPDLLKSSSERISSPAPSHRASPPDQLPEFQTQKQKAEVRSLEPEEDINQTTVAVVQPAETVTVVQPAEISREKHTVRSKQDKEKTLQKPENRKEHVKSQKRQKLKKREKIASTKKKKKKAKSPKPVIQKPESPKFPESKESKEISRSVAEAKSKDLKDVTRESDLNLYVARAYEADKDYYNASKSYKKALEAEPDNYRIMNNISNALLQTGSFEKSMEYSKKALEVKNDYTPALINLGIATIKNGDLPAGESYLLEALTLEPANKYVLYNIALLYEKMKQYDKARNFFSRLFEQKDIQGYLGLARIAEKQARIPDAIALYRVIMRIKGAPPNIKIMANARIRILEK